MTTQRAAVLSLLSDGRWHGALEFVELGILRAAARVHELRRAGHAIETRTRRGHNGAVGEYRLVSSATVPPNPASSGGTAALPLEAFCFECGAPATGQASGQWWCETHLTSELQR